MNVLYIYAHPEPRSFNGALKDTAMLTLARCGHQVKASNLDAIKFKAVLDPVDFRIRANPDLFNPAGEQMHGVATRSLAPDILEEIDKITWADLMIFQLPIWWSYMPAILKGWIDRVFVQGFVVDLRDGRVYPRTPEGQIRYDRSNLWISRRDVHERRNSWRSQGTPFHHNPQYLRVYRNGCSSFAVFGRIAGTSAARSAVPR